MTNEPKGAKPAKAVARAAAEAPAPPPKVEKAERAEPKPEPKPEPVTKPVVARAEPKPPEPEPTGLAGAIKKAVGPQEAPQPAIAAQAPAAPAMRGDIPETPPQGAIQGAIGSHRQAARACVDGHDSASRATIVFASTGKVQTVNVAGPAAGTPAAACIQKTLSRRGGRPVPPPDVQRDDDHQPALTRPSRSAAQLRPFAARTRATLRAAEACRARARARARTSPGRRGPRSPASEARSRFWIDALAPPRWPMSRRCAHIMGTSERKNGATSTVTAPSTRASTGRSVSAE